MRTFAARVFSGLIALWLVFTVGFFLLRLLPGDAITSVMLDSGASADAVAQRQQALGLDQPAPVQYVRALTGLITGDLGVSLQDGQPVMSRIFGQIGATIEVAILALLVSAIVGVGLGIAAVGSPPMASIAGALISAALCLPVFWTGTLVIVIFSVWLGWLPSSGSGTLRHALLPALVLGISGSGAVAQVLRHELSRLRGAPFLIAAAARGLPDRYIFIRHHLRIAIMPVMTALGLQTGYILGGTVITEALFTRPGLGRLLHDAVLRQDYPLVQGIVIWTGLIYLLVRFGVQQLNEFLDPRLHQAE